ncbi:hypothetical protein MRX96_011341 [Rhipicephalus microplus]
MHTIKRSCTYVAVSLTVLGLCALLTATLLLVVPTHLHDTVCTTAACTDLNAVLATSVDRTRDPCDNFYAYVCSGWAQSQNQSVYRSHLLEFLADVHWIHTRVLDPSKAHTAQQMVTAFYQACTAVLVDGNDELPHFRHQLRLAGVTWPQLSPELDFVTTLASVYAAFHVTAILCIRACRRETKNVLEIARDMSFLLGWQTTREQLIRAGAYARFSEETKSKYMENEISAHATLSYEMFSFVEDAILQGLLVHQKKSGSAVEVASIERLVQITRHVPTTIWLAVVLKLGFKKVHMCSSSTWSLLGK